MVDVTTSSSKDMNEYNAKRNEMQKRHNAEIGEMLTKNRLAHDEMDKRHNDNRWILNQKRNDLVAQGIFHGRVMQDWNDENKTLNNRIQEERSKLSEFQNDQRQETYKRQQIELKTLDAEYNPRSPINKILGYVIGAVIAMFVTYYVVKLPAEFHEECSFVEGENANDWAYGYCILSPVDRMTQKLIVFNPGVLGMHSFVKDPFSDKKGVVGGEDHQRFVDLYKANIETAPTILTFALYPSKVEAKDSAFDERISGTLSLYNRERLYYLKTVVFPKVVFPRLKANKDNNIIMGTSKGGFNAMQIAHEFPLIFNKMVLISPMMTTCDPWGPMSADPLKLAAGILTQNWMMVAMSFSNACMKALPHPGKKMNQNGVISLFKSYYPKKELFDAADPFKWEYDARWPKTLVVSTPKDDFPFYDANKRWYEMLRDSGIPVEFKEVDGKHGMFAEREMKEFITKENFY